MSMYSYAKEVNIDRLSQEIRLSDITVALSHMDMIANTVDIHFKADLSAGETTILDTLVNDHINTPIIEDILVKLNEPKTSTGLPKMSMFEPEGASATIVSINYADKCSWYQGAVQVTGGALATSDNLNYTDPNARTHWIDLEHGRLYDEDNIMAQSSNAYKVKVFVDGTEQTTGFTIDYVAGKITFESTVIGVSVTANYWYADKSWFRLRPKAGKILAIKAAEVQFSRSTTLPSPFVFEPWFVDHPLYGTMAIPGEQICYKNGKDFISACNEGQGVIPAWPGGGLTEDVHVFPFQYARPKPIKYSENIEIRVYCKSHEATGGEYATASFYVTIDDE
jgi:hypothetical protein